MVPELIVKAILSAEKPGSCLYVEDNKPCCVIGQLHYLQGGSIEEMEKWDSGVKNSVIQIAESYGVDFAFNIQALNLLQNEWDKKIDNESLDESRSRTLEVAKNLFN